MVETLKPPDKRSPTFFGMHHKGFFVFFSASNMHLCIIVLAVDDIIACVGTIHSYDTTLSDTNERIRFYERLVMWILTGTHCATSTLFDVQVFRTAASPNIRFLRSYTVYHLVVPPILLIWYFYGFISILVKGSNLPFPRNMVTLLLPTHVVYRLYTSYVVQRYSKDIEFDLNMKSGYRHLTDEELAIFELGLQVDNSRKIYPGFESCYEMARFQAYDRKAFEIERKNLDFSESTTLGCGEYGCVLKAHWITNGGRKTVAVKTIDPEVSDIHQFLALLSEAKVMMCMGRHENVIGLLGVCTDEIRERKLFIVCELCDFGSLKTHLRSERNTFINLFKEEFNSDAIPANEVRDYLSTKDLVKWAHEIASGMEFLASKQIVHGDLAARNILLTLSKTAKITDFGLSRRLYNYSVYKKRHNVPLPWRWLALESLLDMNFSTQSDVWSYGITCWEIFELGARPWPDINSFSSDFIEGLRDGNIPAKGELCSLEIYDILCTCWKRDPGSRPSFTDLKKYFKLKRERLEEVLDANM